MTRCDHPPQQRWQYPLHWMCCACCRYFWGKKTETPQADIYGRPA